MSEWVSASDLSFWLSLSHTHTHTYTHTHTQRTHTHTHVEIGILGREGFLLMTIFPELHVHVSRGILLTHTAWLSPSNRPSAKITTALITVSEIHIVCKIIIQSKSLPFPAWRIIKVILYMYTLARLLKTASTYMYMYNYVVFFMSESSKHKI